MTWLSWVWYAGLAISAVYFAVFELIALHIGDKPGKRETLTANVIWLITQQTWWSRGLRLLLSFLFGTTGWLAQHFHLVP